MVTNQRIRKLRRELDLTQQEFAERIGVSRANIGKYETGISEPSAAVLSLICREFDVREEWLRNGEGEMFKPKPSDILDQLAYKYKLFNFDYVMIEKFLAMPPDLRRAIYDHFHDIDAALAEMDPYAPAYTGSEPPRPMDRIMETITSQQKENAVPEMSVEQAEAEYIKKISETARKKESTASNTTGGAKKAASE
ncbi:MAG: helix-turn-helix domain-containing protein [Lachnospiraceae bacterium]